MPFRKPNRIEIKNEEDLNDYNIYKESKKLKYINENNYITPNINKSNTKNSSHLKNSRNFELNSPFNLNLRRIDDQNEDENNQNEIVNLIFQNINNSNDN